MEMKCCTKCGHAFPATTEYFYTSSYRTRSLQSVCKQCRAKEFREYQTSPRGREVRRKAVKKRMAAKGYLADYKREFARNPDHFRARTSLNRAIRAKKIPPAKELTCIRCGNKACQYHHYLGYEERHWRDVIPMCRKCHMLIDRVIKERSHE